MKKFSLALLLIFSLMSISLSAQQAAAKDGYNPGWFIGLNGGANWFLGEGNNFLDGTDRNSWSVGKSMGYLGRLELGYNFNSVYALRFMAGYNQYNQYTKSRSTGVENVRPFAGETLSADLMMNLTNLVKGYDPNRKFTLGAFAGLGIAYMNDNVNTSNIGGSLLRGGLQANYHITPAWALSLIGEANMLSDNVNDGVADMFFDLSPDVAVAISYRFGSEKASTVVIDDKLPMTDKPVVQPETPKVDVVEPAPVVVPETPVVKPEVPVIHEAPAIEVIDYLNEHIFFAINRADVQNTEHEDQMRIIAQYVQQNPDVTIVISGFADRGTGNVDVNNELSKQRAISVANTLIRKYGVPYKNVWVRWYGAGVQPYAEGPKNRLVIVRSPDVKKVVPAGSGIRQQGAASANPAFVPAPASPEQTAEKTEKVDGPLSRVVYFDEKATELSKQDQKDIVMAVALYLRRNPEATVILSGYGDKSADGEKVSNELSKQRAVHIANTLIRTYSIDKDRIHVSWFGSPKEVGGKASLSKVVVIKSR
jgi:OOP family OmpA-OmpF porin